MVSMKARWSCSIIRATRKLTGSEAGQGRGLSRAHGLGARGDGAGGGSGSLALGVSDGGGSASNEDGGETHVGCCWSVVETSRVVLYIKILPSKYDNEANVGCV